ncbi:MAG: histidine--tRNA ligase [Patescibacteria group bacterium]
MARPKKIEKKADKDSEAKTGKKQRKGKRELSTVTGMRDILPQDQKYWEMVKKIATKISLDYGYSLINTPILENLEVFVRGIGKQTDVIEKEMFAFVDQGGDQLALRPEMTASVVRAYIQHGMINQPQPVKLFYLGPMFRHEKPQSGRFRQFYQFGWEAIGEISPALDAQLILMGWNSLNELGLESIIQVNSIGCPACREEYKKELVKYYRPKAKLLCESCKVRLTKNPLRLLDCKEESCRNLREEAPQILDYLDEECKTHFMKVVEYLDELDLPYVLNPYIVRGLDYYTKTIFEYWSIDDNEGKNAFGGGGRYDGLVKIMGGREETPGVGLAMGLDRLVAKLREKEIAIPEIYQPDIFLAQLGEPAKRKAMVLYEKLRKSDFRLAQAFYKDSLKNQLEQANKLKVKFTLILGQKEISDGTILIRDMEGGVQEVVDFNKIVLEIKKRLEKYKENSFMEINAATGSSSEKQNKLINN